MHYERYTNLNMFDIIFFSEHDRMGAWILEINSVARVIANLIFGSLTLEGIRANLY